MKDNKLSDKVIVDLNAISEWLEENTDKSFLSSIALTEEEKLQLVDELRSLVNGKKIGEFTVRYECDFAGDRKVYSVLIYKTKTEHTVVEKEVSRELLKEMVEEQVEDECEEVKKCGCLSCLTGISVPNNLLNEQKKNIKKIVSEYGYKVRFLDEQPLTSEKDMTKLTYEIIAPKSRGTDIDLPKYKYRKRDEYDNDICVLFYNGYKVMKGMLEYFSKSLMEESPNYDKAEEMFVDGCGYDIQVPKEQWGNESWATVWDKLDFDHSSQSYKYGKWEFVCLDL